MSIGKIMMSGLALKITACAACVALMFLGRLARAAPPPRCSRPPTAQAAKPLPFHLWPGDPDAPAPEETALIRVQAGLAGRPGVLPAARGRSHLGEHSLGWLIIGALAAVIVPARRREWLTMVVGTFAAHAAAVLIKRVVRRRRPDHPAVAVHVLSLIHLRRRRRAIQCRSRWAPYPLHKKTREEM